MKNPRIAKSTGFYKIGDTVLADWVLDSRRRGVIVGIEPNGKYVVKIGDNTYKKFYEEDLDFLPSLSFSGNPRLKHNNMYIVQTKNGIPIMSHKGFNLIKKHAQEWANKTGICMIISRLGV